MGIPKTERDVLILGDLNDSTHTRQSFRYIFDYAEAAGFTHLGGDLPSYPDTRVNGSQIDHILASKDAVSSSVDASTFTVHNVPQAERKQYRTDFSDHFPVTVDLDATADGD